MVSKQKFFKWFKRVTLVLGIIPILLFLAFAGAVTFIDFNQYKPQIEQEVSDYTGREFNIDGTIEVSVFPFELSATELVLKNPEGFDSKNILSVQAVQVELSFWSLLRHKKMDVVRLELFEPKLHLIKTETGDNWSDIKGLSAWLKRTHVNENRTQSASEWFDSLERIQVSLSPEVEQAPQEEKALNQAAPWALDSLVVRNGKIQVYDKAKGFAETFLKVNILTFDVVQDKPFDMSSDFTYQNSLSERMYDVHLNGTLAVKNQFKIWQLSEWNGMFKVRLPEEQKVPEIRLTTQGDRFEFDIETLQIEVENGTLSGLDGQLKTSFSGQFGLNTLLSGKVTLKQLRFKEWAKHLNLPLPTFVNQQALSEGNGQFEWFWDGTQLLLNDINVLVDDSKLQGDLSYNFEGPHALRFELSLDTLNLDFYQAYLPSEGGKKNVDSKKVYIPIPLSVGFLTQANVLGGLNITQLTALNVKVDTLEVEVLVEQGVLQLAPLDATLYQGELLSRLHIDLASEQPSFHWKGRINHLALEPLAKLQSSPLLLGGSLVSRFDLSSKGAQLKEVKSNVNGRLSFTIENAKLAGIDLNKVLAGELDLNPITSSAPYTELQNVTLVGRWSDGIYSARKLDVMSERFSASGAGTFDLSTAQIDTTFNVLVREPKGGLDILKGLNFPLTYRGKLHSSTSTLDDRAHWEVNVAHILSATKVQEMLIQSFLNTLKN